MNHSTIIGYQLDGKLANLTCRSGDILKDRDTGAEISLYVNHGIQNPFEIDKDSSTITFRQRPSMEVLKNALAAFNSVPGIAHIAVLENTHFLTAA